jgi:MYXO-CTERM domain-containing protein
MRLAAPLFALLLATSATLWSPPIEATSCAVPELQSSTENADVVFVGTAGKIEQTGHGSTRVLFRVDRVHKGSVPAALTLDAGGMKGATFEAGKRYLVFAILPERRSDESSLPFAHLCGGSQLASDGHAWVASLGAGNPPARTGSPVVSGKSAAPAPSASSTPVPAPSAPAPQPDPSPSAAPPLTIDAPAPSTSPPPPGEQPRSGGCAGCTSAAPPSAGAPITAAVAALLVALRRRARAKARG